MKLNRKEENPEIPTASMADIAFLLIVFFMLTTVFSTNKGVEHLLPPQEDIPENVDNEESIYIQIFPSGQFQIDRKPYTIEDADEVYNYVMSKVQQNAQKPIIIHTNREAKYGDMMIILSEVKRVGKDLKANLAITLPSREERQRYDQFQGSL
ncbi:MAG: biopolymer transporter ExbD [Acidobacteria bacterium]|nr:biopolymer transporter ExbD [Acidobacteriota bacterium]MCB9399237.1 biopolymer transporter ExbD [Acidobacteriota bacterium]